MIVAIHQPNYLPWLGFFYKIYASDVFVFHDDVEFSKASYTKRCMIRKEKHSTETTWLSVPVKKHHTGTRISQIKLSLDRDWQLKHLRKVENTYGTAPCFDANFSWLREILMVKTADDSLAGNNIRLILAIAERLGLKTRFSKSSELSLNGSGNVLNFSIASQLGATEYLAGTGSRKYQDAEIFHKNGIRTRTVDLGSWLKAHPFDQGTDTFTPGLSCIDALMQIGVKGILQIFKEFQSSISQEVPTT